jgi:protein-S-isoprenylcysteine O-methyltransferase Ste14
MRRLETTVPPLIWMLLAGLVSWLVSMLDVDGSWLDGGGADTVATLSGIAGISITIAGVLAFRRGATTVDPHNIENASALVSNGPYRFTRNPMYLGMVFVIAAWSLGIGTLIGLVVAEVMFVAVMTRLQIQPEERMLSSKFGVVYDQYCTRVRRWA